MARSPLIPRRKPRDPSPRERWIEVILLVILAGIVALFFLSGRRPGPIGLEEASARTAAGTEGAEGAGSPLASLAPLSPGGWPRGAVETYDVDTLFEKINGKADAYLAYDFQSMTFASYAAPDGTDAFVDVSIYDLGAPLDAFGVYRGQRDTTSETLDLGDEGGRAGEAIAFRRGRYFVDVYGSGPETGGELEAVARAVAAALPAGEAPIETPPGLPTEGLRTIRFDRFGALGIESLEDAFVAIYEDGTRIVVAARGSVSEVEETLAFLGEKATFHERETGGLVGVVGPKDEITRRTLLDAVMAAVMAASPKEEDE